VREAIAYPILWISLHYQNEIARLKATIST